jgi:hypothetical protein
VSSAAMLGSLVRWNQRRNETGRTPRKYVTGLMKMGKFSSIILTPEVCKYSHSISVRIKDFLEQYYWQLGHYPLSVSYLKTFRRLDSSGDKDWLYRLGPIE